MIASRYTYQAKHWSRIEGGGYIWHTTGSGKTLTSFKAARLATELDFIDKVFFVVDRKDLDHQIMREYQRFSPDSVNGSENTARLKCNLDQDDNKIIVTTIQKLNNLMKTESDLAIYNKQVVFIFDECHRSQFGEAQKNLQKKFKRFYQFGFTGTPIFPQNALGADTTASVFGRELHSYVITDAIRDEKVLKFKVDYNDVRPQFKAIETEQDEQKLNADENKQALLHPDRLRQISQYILNNFRQKTHRLQGGGKGFNALFAVSSVDAAKLYYETFKQLQKDSDKSKGELIEEVRRLIRSSLGNRAKESLIVDFINQTNLDEMVDKASIIDRFFEFAQAEQAREAEELIRSEGLKVEAAKRYISASLKREFASENGTELNSTLPTMSPLNPQYKAKKQSVFQKISAFVEKFKGVGGQI